MKKSFLIIFSSIAFSALFAMPVRSSSQSEQIPSTKESLFHRKATTSVASQKTSIKAVTPSLKINAQKIANAKAGAGAFVRFVCEDRGDFGSFMQLLFFASSRFTSDDVVSAVYPAFTAGKGELERLYNSAIYRFPPNTSPRGGYNRIDTLFTIAAGEYDLLNTDFDPSPSWIEEGFADGVAPIGFYDNYRFRDGYYYEIYLIVGVDNIGSPTYGHFYEVELPATASVVYDILTPENSLSLGANENVKVVIASMGVSELTSAIVYLKINDQPVKSYKWRGGLGFMESDTVSFTADFSAEGRYELKSWVTAGDITIDTVAATVIHLSLVNVPWSDCFDSEHLSWNIIDLNGGSTWTMAKATDEWFLNGSAANGYVAKYSFHSYLPGNDYLVSLNPFNFAAGGTYFVNVSAAASTLGYTEEYSVYYGKSIDEMIFIGTKELKKGPVFEDRAFLITPSETGAYHVAIKAVSKQDRLNMFVNCVSVDTGLPPKRVEITGLNLPFSSVSLGVTEKAAIVMLNNGAREIDRAEVYVQAGENTALLQVYSGSLQSDATDTVIFDLDLSAVGTHSIKAWVVLDDFISDTVKGRVTHSTVQALPWRDNFDVEHTAWDIHDINGAKPASFGVWRMVEYLDSNFVAAYTTSAELPGNDFLVTVAPFALKAGGDYHIAASTSVASAHYTEKIKVYFGTNPDPTKMTLIDSAEMINTFWIDRGFNFTAPTDGNYYIAIEAASDPARYDLYIDYVRVDTGVFIARTDLALTFAEWQNVYSSCKLSTRGQALVIVENNGGITASEYAVSYRLNDGEWKEALQTTPIQSGDFVIVLIDSLDLSADGQYILTMAVSSSTADDDTLRLETGTMPPVAVPFNSNFTEREIDGWTGDRWFYYDQSAEYVYDIDVPGYGLMSKCVSLEEGRTYEFNMAYWANQASDYGIYTSFDVLIGEPGADVETFRVLRSYNRVETIADDVNDKDTTSFDFSVQSSGDYVFCIMTTEFTFDPWDHVVSGISSYLGISYINIFEKGKNTVALPVKAANALSVYPTPVGSVLTVDGVRNGEVSIVDMTGRTVLQRKVGSTRILLDVQTLPGGIYVLRSGDQTTKFIKK